MEVHFRLPTLIALEAEWRDAVSDGKSYTKDTALSDQWKLLQALLEEIGEAARAMGIGPDRPGHDLQAELLQVACRSLDWYQRLT